MKSKKTRLVILFGGKSEEHTISVQSAQHIYKALDKNKYAITLIGIDRQGLWGSCDPQTLLGTIGMYKTNLPYAKQSHIRYDCGIGAILPMLSQAEVIFPVLHGPYGEDGRVQGFIELLGIPYIGSGVLGSAVSMDKEITKRLLQSKQLPVAPWVSFRRTDDIDIEALIRLFGLPLFVKPASLGSSIGITKVHTSQKLLQAINLAFSYDEKLIIEKMIEGREIECSVLGNERPIVSLPGEILTSREYYDYEAKYADTQTTKLSIPAQLSQNN
jgi:D-alanine-D-alanine ligase